MVSCVLFAPDTKCEVLVGLSWCLVYCLHQIQSVRYWLVSHSVLFAPDTKCEVLVGLSWCLVYCLLQIQSVRYWLVTHGVLCIVCSRYKV